MAAVTAVISQAVIVTAWADAAAGSAANVALLLAAGYGYASQGPGSFRAEYRRRAAAALAEPVFDDHAELIDFVSDDRMAATPGGGRFTPQRWSTPLRDYGRAGPYRLATAGEGWWHPDDEPAFAYIELHLDDVVHNPGTAAERSDTASRVAQPVR